MKKSEFIDIFETIYPKESAMTWDNVGLQIGSSEQAITSILLSLDVTVEVIEEAIKKGANLIVAHHPLILSPIKDINTDNVKGKIIELLLKNDITLYIGHTNFDVANEGMDMILANMLELDDLEHLEQTSPSTGLGKIGTIKSQSMRSYINHVKQVFDIEHALFIGDIDANVTKVAILGGSGTVNMDQAKEAGADLFITGDITYHKALDMKMMNLNSLDVGHHIEQHFVKALKKVLIEHGVQSEIHISQINTNPYKLV